MDKIIYATSFLMGADPELFFTTTDGKVVGSEKVIPSGSLAAPRVKGLGQQNYMPNPQAFVLDGVQVELNPSAHICRANLGNELQAAFRSLRTHLANMKDITVCFDSVVNVDPIELASLSEKSREFGCAPSMNVYGEKSSVTVNAATYLKRAAGGHIHMGLDPLRFPRPVLDRLGPIMDILVGNTSVMIDRDPEAAERRKYYGRAGEVRYPPHGLEYRTLSNFWLRSYQLMSFVMGLTRMAVGVMHTTLSSSIRWDAEADLLKRVDLERVREAINQNDLSLAKQNWYNGIRQFIYEHVPYGTDMSLAATTLPVFDYFTRMIEEKGIQHWFPQNPMDHWCNMPEGHNHGWESWLRKYVAPMKQLDEYESQEAS